MVCSMSGRRPDRAFASYRDAVAELIESGEPFGVVEDAIDDFAEPSEDTRAALWLLAFMMHEQRRDGRAHLMPVRLDPR